MAAQARLLRRVTSLSCVESAPCCAPSIVVSHYTKDNPYPARITENRLLNKPGSGKETRHFIVHLGDSGLHYKAGDSLGVYPTNRPSEVAEVLQLLGATGDEPVLLPKIEAPIPLREALSHRLALSGPTRKFVEAVADKATDSEQQAKLVALLAPEAKEQLQAFLDEREFVDLLAEFPSAKFAPQEFVVFLRKLMPRLYSIASSPRQHPNEIHLCVAVVRYWSNGRDRVGVCSTYLADRALVNDTLAPVFVTHAHFGPPEDHTKDAIMVGPGTGVAPFRAFLQDRVKSGASGRNWLFFGDQRRATDYLYGEEFDAHHAAGQLTRLDLAFSRDQEQKIYVQDRMRESGAELWKWLDGGAHFYVCGDAKRMAKDVDATLHAIIVEHGGKTPEQAVEYVKAMKKEKRYQRDVY